MVATSLEGWQPSLFMTHMTNIQHVSFQIQSMCWLAPCDLLSSLQESKYWSIKDTLSPCKREIVSVWLRAPCHIILTSTYIFSMKSICTHAFNQCTCHALITLHMRGIFHRSVLWNISVDNKPQGVKFMCFVSTIDVSSYFYHVSHEQTWLFCHVSHVQMWLFYHVSHNRRGCQLSKVVAATIPYWQLPD